MATATDVKYQVHHHRATRTVQIPTADPDIQVTALEFDPCGGWTQVDILDENDAVVKSGIARCHPNDNYSRSIGRDIALGRALSDKDPNIVRAPGVGEVTFSDRGFKSLPEIKTSYGQKILIYESSAAEEPHVWLGVTSARDGERYVNAHLSFADIDTVIAQLRWLKRHHYHNERGDA